MKLETEEPTHGAFAMLGYAFENPVVMNPPVVADLQRCGIHVRNTRTLAKQHLLDEKRPDEAVWISVTQQNGCRKLPRGKGAADARTHTPYRNA